MQPSTIDEGKRVRDARYRALNKQRIKHRKSRFYREHRDEILARGRVYNLKNQARYKAYQKEYKAAHKKELKAYAAARRARKLGVSIGDLRAILAWEKGWKAKKTAKCRWCRRRRPVTKCHSDHIHPLSKGGAHSLQNLCIACAPCNLKKRDKSLETWLKELETISLSVETKPLSRGR